MKIRAVWLSIMLFPAAAQAGQNAGAVILAGAGAWTGSTTCTSLQRTDCSSIGSHYPSHGGPNNYLAVYIARDPSPLCVTGIDFGISYGGCLQPTLWVKCGDLEDPTPNWPQSGSGNTVVWASPRTGNVVLVGYFKIQVFYGGWPHPDYLFVLGPNPYFGQMRVLDSGSNFDVLSCCGGCLCCGDCTADYYAEPVAVRNGTWGRIKSQYEP